MLGVLTIVCIVSLVGFLSTGSIVLGAIWAYTTVKIVKATYGH